MQRSKVALKNYMETNLNHYIECYIGSSAQIVYATFQIALAKAHKNVLLHNMLKLGVASRLVEKPWRICGIETLGMIVEDSEGTPYAEEIPIRPVMDSIGYWTRRKPQMLLGINQRASLSSIRTEAAVDYVT
ncbi:hypothetical protein Hte_007795 [Hypoxylon texense]